MSFSLSFLTTQQPSHRVLNCRDFRLLHETRSAEATLPFARNLDSPFQAGSRFEETSLLCPSLPNKPNRFISRDSGGFMHCLFCDLHSRVCSLFDYIECSYWLPCRALLGTNWSCLAGRLVAWQFVLLVGALGIGSLIRTRRWSRISRRNSDRQDSTVIARIEKLEEEVRSSVTIIRVLSRQLEKLGIRFRVTRKSLKEPIAETAALAQKNSEVTRALTIQEDILEKELGEIQKVLLAMQEQQQKQLELILAVAKAGRLKKNNQDTVSKGRIVATRKSVQESMAIEETENQL